MPRFEGRQSIPGACSRGLGSGPSRTRCLPSGRLRRAGGDGGAPGAGCGEGGQRRAAPRRRRLRVWKGGFSQDEVPKKMLWIVLKDSVLNGREVTSIMASTFRYARQPSIYKIGRLFCVHLYLFCVYLVLFLLHFWGGPCRILHFQNFYHSEPLFFRSWKKVINGLNEVLKF